MPPQVNKYTSGWGEEVRGEEIDNKGGEKKKKGREKNLRRKCSLVTN